MSDTVMTTLLHLYLYVILHFGSEIIYTENWMLWYLHFVGKKHEDNTTDSALQRTINLPVTGEAKKSK
jgi:hypothetical protein